MVPSTDVSRVATAKIGQLLETVALSPPKVTPILRPNAALSADLAVAMGPSAGLGLDVVLGRMSQ